MKLNIVAERTLYLYKDSNTHESLLYSKKYEKNENASAFANEALGGLAFILLILTTLAIIFMPALIWAIANGFVGDERFDLTVAFGRIMFPYILAAGVHFLHLVRRLQVLYNMVSVV